MSKKLNKKECNHALCPADYPDCPEDCKHCQDILSLSQGDCRFCWETYFNRTVKGWTKRELENQHTIVTVNAGTFKEIFNETVEKINALLLKEPNNDGLKELKMFMLEELVRRKILENSSKLEDF